MIVLVQAIGHATESAECFQSAHQFRLDRVARAVHLVGAWAFGAESFDLGIDDLFQLLSRVSRTRSRLDAEERSEHQRVLRGRDVLRDL